MGAITPQFGPKPIGPKYGQPIVPNLNVKHVCPNCRNNPPNIIEEYSKGDLVCGDCGTILGDRVVDTRSEWRTFASDEGGADPSRVGQAGNGLIKNDLDTQVSGLDGRSGQSGALARAQMRANAATGGLGRSNHNAITNMFGKIHQKCDAMQLQPNITQRAQHVYKIADEQRVIRGKNEKAIVAACIIFACRDAGSSRTFAEVCRACQVSKKEINTVFAAVRNAVQNDRRKKGQDTSTFGVAQTVQSVEALLSRFSNYLALGIPVYNVAKHVAAEAQKRAQIDGRNPVSIASGVLYMTCVLMDNKKGSLAEIIKVANISGSTVKLITKLITDHLDAVIRPEWKEQFPAGYAQLAAIRDKSMAKGESPKESRGATPMVKDDTMRVGTPKPVSVSLTA
ncbi:hypothetical protein M231_04217 [Tremella mesenterica]|uniref:General transcription factor TFIIB n=1 Tax=Tremella mesenterica TaxID=5217 RepID=A0A4Q1BLE3_TREME|nr:hypothetical protein M231_04217 [Tremella mesenterica]